MPQHIPVFFVVQWFHISYLKREREKKLRYRSFVLKHISLIPIYYTIILLFLFIIIIVFNIIKIIILLFFTSLSNILESMHIFTYVNENNVFLFTDPFTDHIQVSFFDCMYGFEHRSIFLYECTCDTNLHIDGLVFMNESSTDGSGAGGDPGGLSNGDPGGLPNGDPGGLPNGDPGGLPNGDPGGDPGGLPNGNPGGLPNGDTNFHGPTNPAPYVGGDDVTYRCLEVFCSCEQNNSCICIENRVDHVFITEQADPIRHCCYCDKEISGEMLSCLNCDCKFCTREVGGDVSTGNESDGGHDPCAIAHTHPEGSIEDSSEND